MLIIKTERLVLRPLALSDLKTTHEYASDTETTKYMVYLPNRTLQETESFLRSAAEEWAKAIPQFCEFAITLGGTHIGAVSISLSENGQTGELGWIINKKYQGNGYATEAAKAITKYAINTLQVKRIIAHCDYRNAASYRVMQKLGMRLESDTGTRRNKGADEDVQDLKYSMNIK